MGPQDWKPALKCAGRRQSNTSAPNSMKLDPQDYALRVLILMAGAVAAILLTLEGHGEALPALAAGATLGAAMMSRFDATER